MTKSRNVLSHFSCLILTISRVYTLLHVSPNKTACARQHDQRLSNAVLYSLLRQEDQYTLHVTVPVSLTASSLPPSHDMLSSRLCLSTRAGQLLSPAVTARFASVSTRLVYKSIICIITSPKTTLLSCSSVAMQALTSSCRPLRGTRNITCLPALESVAAGTFQMTLETAPTSPVSNVADLGGNFGRCSCFVKPRPRFNFDVEAGPLNPSGAGWVDVFGAGLA